MPRKQKIKHGDIFAVPITDREFVYGRVMLDVHACLKRRLFSEDSLIPSLGKCFLVEMYDFASESPNDFEGGAVLIPGAFIDSERLGDEWSIVNNVEVDPKDVSFPEALIGKIHKNGQTYFTCGEINLPLPFDLNIYRSMNVYLTCNSSFSWSQVCLKMLGRHNEISPDHAPSRNLSSRDLRFSPHREKVYLELEIDPADSYYEQQASLGLNLERFYE